MKGRRPLCGVTGPLQAMAEATVWKLMQLQHWLPLQKRERVCVEQESALLLMPQMKLER